MQRLVFNFLMYANVEVMNTIQENTGNMEKSTKSILLYSHEMSLNKYIDSKVKVSFWVSWKNNG